MACLFSGDRGSVCCARSRQRGRSEYGIDRHLGQFQIFSPFPLLAFALLAEAVTLRRQNNASRPSA